jgi:hypothetical protein
MILKENNLKDAFDPVYLHGEHVPLSHRCGNIPQPAVAR